MQTQQKRLIAVIITSLLSLTSSQMYAQASSSNAKTYQLLIYTARAGRLPELETLFRKHALPRLAKHGIENVFDATVLEGARIDGSDASNMLVCILAHRTGTAADHSWATFENDKRWKPLLAKPPVSIYMSEADFSPALEPAVARSATRVFELRKYNVGPNGLPRTIAEFKSGLAGILSKNGMTPIAYWTADDRSAFIYLLAHNDRESARKSWASFITDFRPFIAEFNSRNPAPPTDRKPDDNRFLLPTDFSPRQ